ncbi:MAG: hypothetical protein EXS05_14785 [Planctomycetaceae bacterium]|nr:hypothetical protein [Planctomycetaceae bacterium]
MAKLELPFHLRFFRIVVETGIEWLGLSGRLQIFGQLPPLEDLLDLFDECRKFCPELSIGFRRFEKVEELLADEISKGLVGPELRFD